MHVAVNIYSYQRFGQGKRVNLFASFVCLFKQKNI